jgi:hypothetical protein
MDAATRRTAVVLLSFFVELLISALCRFCCKSLFELVIKISFGCTHDFRVKMWGTSSPEDKLTGDLGNVIEANSIGGRRSRHYAQRQVGPQSCPRFRLSAISVIGFFLCAFFPLIRGFPCKADLGSATIARPRQQERVSTPLSKQQADKRRRG